MKRSIAWMVCLLTAGCVGRAEGQGSDPNAIGDTDPTSSTQDTDLCPEGTTVHEGTATVWNTDDLAALRCVREITGALDIQHTLLTTLDGLEALETVGEGVHIVANVDLRSIEGLQALTACGDLGISGALSLTSLTGLERLTTVRSVAIDDAPVLVSVQALRSISHLEGGLSLVGAAVTSLDGLQGLTTIDDGLQIAINRELASIDALAALATVGGTMSFSDNGFLCQSDVDALAGRLGTSCMDCTRNGQARPECAPLARFPVGAR